MADESVFTLEAIAKKLARLGAEPGAPSGDIPRAAVAAVLRDVEGAAELFFIRRAERPHDPWSGHIAFPGGRWEPGDRSLLATASRETREEVGIDLGGAELLARLPDVPAFTRSKRTTLIVTPFVFAVRDVVAALPNVAEVSATLWVPFARFTRGEGKSTFTWSWEGKALELPCFRLEPHDDLLWGMTYRMLETMLEALVLDASGSSDAIAGG